MRYSVSMCSQTRLVFLNASVSSISRFVPVKVLTVHRLTLGEGAFKPLPCFTCSSVVHAHLHEGNLEDIQSSLLYNVMVVQCYGPVTKGAHVFCRPDLGEAK